MLKGIIPAVGTADLIKHLNDQKRTYFLSGRLVAKALLGSDNEGLIALSEYSQVLRDVKIETDQPIIADAQSGFGNPLSMWNTAIELDRSGADYLMMNDQKWPSHSESISGSDDDASLLGKIKAAIDGSSDSGVKVIVKLEGFANYKYEGLVQRIKLALKAGAEAVVVARVNKDQLQKLSQEDFYDHVGVEIDDEKLTLSDAKSLKPAFIIPVTTTLEAIKNSQAEIKKDLN